MPQSRAKKFGAETWSKGTRGLKQDPHTDQARIVDMRPYASGSLGVRPEWELQTTLATYQSGSFFPCKYQDLSDGVTSPVRWGFAVVEYNKVAFYTWGDPTILAYTDVSADPNNGLGVDPNSPVSQISDFEWLVGGAVITFVSSVGPGLPHKDIGVVDAASALMSRFGMSVNSFDLDASILHQNRAYYWGPRRGLASVTYDRNRVYFSDELAYGVFSSADQYFDVDGVVAGCVSVGGSLFIWTEHGAWTVMQGSGPPELQTFNALARGKVPSLGRYPTVIDTAALFLSSDELSLVAINSSGTIDDITLKHLGTSLTAKAYSEGVRPSLAASSLYDTTMHAGLDEVVYHNLNGVWVEEDWSFLGDWLDYFTVQVSEEQAIEMMVVRHAYRAGIATPNPDVYTRAVAIGEYDDMAGAGDVRGVLVLPRIQVQEEVVKLHRVEIDVRLWGDARLTVKSFGEDVSEVELAREDNTPLLGLGGTPRRLVYYTGDDAGYTAFTGVELSGMANIVIEQVTVRYESQKDSY